MLRPGCFTPGNDSVPVALDGGCARAGLDGCGIPFPNGIQSPDLPARGPSLYRLRYSVTI